MYRLAPITVDDALAYVTEKLRLRGYEVHPTGVHQWVTEDGERIFLSVWGRPIGWQPKPPKAAGVAQASA
jgi:hypothetical protein